MLTLSNLAPHPGSRKSRKRIGRGPGSGSGKTAGRGHKGYKARSGSGIKPGFEGGQMPLQRRIPKRGFHNPFAKRYTVLNVEDLNHFEAGTKVDRALLMASGLIKAQDQLIKILGNGDLKVSLCVVVDKFSDSARRKIEGVGGSVGTVA